MRIVFRSEDRYRGPIYAASAAPSSATATSEEGEAAAAVAGRVFAMRESVEADGRLRLTLLGDLDLAVADTLSARLEELKAAGSPVRLDLSRLAFIDSTGVQALLVALTDARWTGWRLEVAREVSPSVERAAQIVGIAEVLWPQERPAPGSDLTTSAPDRTA
jgi:anti-anti-sigma factor